MEADAGTKQAALSSQFGLTGQQIQGLEQAVAKYKTITTGSQQQTETFGGDSAAEGFKFNNVISAVQGSAQDVMMKE